MMKQETFTIISNERVARGSYELRLGGKCPGIIAGQFVQISLEGFFLRRPFSVCDCDGKSLTVVYHVSGRGTEAMSALPAGQKLDVLIGLGNGFDTSLCGSEPMLIGGGSGLTPLYLLCRQLVSEGVRPSVALGFGSAEDVFYAEKFAELGAELIIFTADGSKGRRGLVTEILSERTPSFIYACGPLPMLRAIAAASSAPAEFSLEARMGCGFGACMGCTIETSLGAKRVCKDGPVFKREELIW